MFAISHVLDVVDPSSRCSVDTVGEDFSFPLVNLYRGLASLLAQSTDCVYLLLISFGMFDLKVFLNEQKRELSARSKDNFDVLYALLHLSVSQQI